MSGYHKYGLEGVYFFTRRYLAILLRRRFEVDQSWSMDHDCCSRMVGKFLDPLSVANLLILGHNDEHTSL